MLEQQIDERFAAIAPRRRVQQIRVLVRESRIDEAGRAECERLPVERLGEDRRKDCAQHAPGVLGSAEHGLENSIVWSGEHRCVSLGISYANGKLVGNKEPLFISGRSSVAIRSMDKDAEAKL